MRPAQRTSLPTAIGGGPACSAALLEDASNREAVRAPFRVRYTCSMALLLPLLFACTALPPTQTSVSVETLELVDTSRSTPDLNGSGELPHRILTTWLWMGPSSGADAGDRALLLLAHGVDGHPDKFDAFASHLAEQGIVVAAPAFPSSNRDAGNGLLGAADVLQQPDDLRFVLDTLLDGQLDPDSPVWRRFDPTQIAVMGHSLGGATVLGYTRFGEGDARIGAQAYLSPATILTAGFGSTPDPMGPPTLVMHGLQDGTLPPELSTTLVGQLDAPWWYLGIEGAGHSDPVEDDQSPPVASRDAAQRAVLAWLDTAFEGSTALSDTLAGLESEGHVTTSAP
jgi:dienelactone hydrolase